jgi:predicted transcriptional regulator
MANDSDVKRLLWFVFSGSRGGLNRLKIISKIKENPSNINQLAKELNLDYKAIQHHIRVLEKNNLISKVGEKYGVTYFVSPFLKSIWRHLQKLKKNWIKVNKSSRSILH